MPQDKFRVLNIGMDGEDVEILQKALIARGFPISDELGHFAKDTKKKIQAIQKRFGFNVTGIADEAFFDFATNPFRLKGRVTQANGTPIAAAHVRIIEKKLLSQDDIILQNLETNSDGTYEIEYLANPNVASDLLVQIIGLQDDVIATSPIVINVAQEQSIDLIVAHESYPELPEYHQLQNHLTPFTGETALTDLDQKAVSYLSGKSRINPVNIAFLVQANRLARQTGISAEVFYGMFRMNLPTSLPALFAQDKKIQRQAIENAVAANVISSKRSIDQLDAILNKLEEQKKDHLLQKPDLLFEQSSFGSLLAIPGITDEQKLIFVKTYINHNATNDEFWNELLENDNFDEATIDSLQLTTQLGALTQNHIPLMQSVHQHLRQNGQGIRALVGKTEAEWLEEIRQHKDENDTIILPATLPTFEGELPEETYARKIMRTLADTFPTPALLTSLHEEDFPGASTVQNFVNEHDFEFQDKNLRTFLQNNNHNLSDTAQKDLFAFKRIFDLAPKQNRHQIMRPLLRDGLRSAFAIQKIGQKNFLQRYSGEMGPTAALQIYQAATQKTAVASALFAANSPLLNNLDLSVIPQENIDELLSNLQGIDLPTWESLFGSVSFCACEHCRSVYSPAAYLVDLLRFLTQQKTNGKSALEVLFERRGDIGKIALNCQNTNVTLPYVDLVIEVLERYLSNEQAASGTDWWNIINVPQTTGEAENLRVYPESITADAYDLLEIREYPWTLPFSLWDSEIRSYLKLLGVSREEIIKRFTPHAEDELPDTIRNDIAREQLALIPRERDLIVGNIAGGVAAWGGSNEQELRNVKTLLQQGQMSYYELLQLLDTQTINPNKALFIQFSTNDLCNLTNATIPSLQMTPHADNIHRFMRLQRKLGWTIHELDFAITVLSQGNINLMLLRQVSIVNQLHLTLKIPILTVLSWWSSIDTARVKDKDFQEHPSLYDTIFLNKTIGNTEELQIFLLNETRNELADTTSKTITDVKASLLAVLGLNTEEELDVILQKRQLDNTLTLANLSELYQIVSLANALKLSVIELLYFIELTGFDPFNLANIEEIHQTFLSSLSFLKSSGFQVFELGYLLHHHFAKESKLALSDTKIRGFLFRLRSGLQKITNQYQYKPDPNGVYTAQLLAQLLPEAEITQAIIVISGMPDSKIPGNQENLLDRNALIAQYFSPFVTNIQTLKAQLVEGVDPTSYLDPIEQALERFETILKPLLAHLHQTNSIRFVQQSFADFLQIDLRVSHQLLHFTKAISDPTLPATMEFLNDVFIESEQEELLVTDFPAQYQMIHRLQKIVTLINYLDIPSEEINWFIHESTQVGWLDIHDLPTEKQAPNQERFNAWLQMAKFSRFQKEIFSSNSSLFTVLRRAYTGTGENGTLLTKEDFIQILHNKIGWNQSALETLLDANHFNLSFPTDFTGKKALEQLLRLSNSLNILDRLGISAARAWEWATPIVTHTIANEVKQVAKAKFDEKTWLSVAEPIRDALRIKQRTHLIDAAIQSMKQTQTHVKEPKDLFGFFLMDIEMNPCMLTSRIKQAISSVQLFIQRCFLGVEEDVILGTEATHQWKWIKNYRVWEANRKIFLYPENWILPELKPEKSPFFVDLENELLQNDVTQESVEIALLTYLEKLDKIAHLEIVSTYHDEERKTLHVLGRTKGIPHQYFYRRWEKRRRWTPWETIPVEMEGKNVAITFYNHRLYLFWFIVQEKTVDADNTTSAVPKVSNSRDPGFETQKPNKYLEIKLAFSQYRNGKWTAKRISSVSVETKSKSEPWEEGIFTPKPLFSNQSDHLLIAVELIRTNTALKNGKWVIVRDHRRNPRRRFCASILNSKEMATNSTFKFFDDNHIEIAPYATGQELRLSLPIQAAPEVFHGKAEKRNSKGPLYIRNQDGRYVEVLKNAPSYHVITPKQHTAFSSRSPLFFSDSFRNYFVVPYTSFRTNKNPSRLTANLEILDVESAHDFVLPENSGLVESLFEEKTVLDPAPFSRPFVSASSTLAEEPVNVVSSLDKVVPGVPLLENPLIAKNIYGTEVATSVIGQGEFSNNAGTTSGLLANLLAARTQPTALAMNTTSETPFAMDRASLVGVNAILPTADTNQWTNPIIYLNTSFQFHIHYYPYASFLIKQVNRYGIDGLLNPKEGGEADELRRQQKKEDGVTIFEQMYQLGDNINKINLPKEEFDFTYTGAYALYNWELFFHVPFLIATRLSANQQFEEAQKWFHYIFDPTDVSNFQQTEDRTYRFWKIKPFFENRTSNNIRGLLELLTSHDPNVQTKREALEAQIADWRENPFQPHHIAQQRIVAYQKAIVMKYLDNVIAWGDHLFQRDSIESINEATQLYLLAAKILGKRPETIPSIEREYTINGNVIKTFNDLETHLDDFGNALVQIENELPSYSELPAIPENDTITTEVIGTTPFFCIPRNSKLLRYWDIILDRLFKIRNCMNLQGIERQLNLFEPPIDPDVLLRSSAAGVDVSKLLNDMNAPHLQYRYRVLVQKALEFCIDVKQLGAALLSALERRDAETLSLLRSSHEERLLREIKSIRQLQLREAESMQQGLEKSLEAIQERQSFYATREARISNEKLQINKLKSANTKEEIARGTLALKTVLALVPQLTVGGSGFGGSPHIVGQFGGIQLSGAIEAASQVLSFLALRDRNESNLASILANFDRRQEDWDFQADQANKEIAALTKQIEGAKLRIAIAEYELNNQELQIEQNREVDEFMRMKFSTQELYSWMSEQISTIYFQSYQLAYEMAKRAQRSYQYEIADYETTFVEFGYWDSLKKGLLAGEQLHYDLRRMESAYFEANKREYELTKHISLLQLNPVALIQLKETGSCEIDVPEVLFDIDYPGQLLRRINSVSLSIPCVTGPYTTVNCTLSLLGNRIRLRTDSPNDPYGGLDDTRFISDVGGTQSIATSTAQEDTGLFVFDFRDERYLPFEGAGAISRWRLELPSEYPQFDYDTIADVIMHMRYTAREGGTGFKALIEQKTENAINELIDTLNQKGLFHLISMKHEFGTAFHQFLHPAGAREHQTLISLSKQFFPPFLQKKSINIQNVVMILTLYNTSLYNNINPLILTISRDGSTEHSEPLLSTEAELGNLAYATYEQLNGVISNKEDWIFTIREEDLPNLSSTLKQIVNIDGNNIERIKVDEIKDIGILLHYNIS